MELKQIQISKKVWKNAKQHCLDNNLSLKSMTEQSIIQFINGKEINKE
jgi:hypothetical protein